MKQKLKHFYQQLLKSSFLHNRFLNIAIKLTIIFAVSYSIYRRISSKGNVEELWSEFINRLSFPNLYWLFLTFLIIPIIPSLEIRNWKLLIQKIIPDISWKKVGKAVFAGYSMAIFTPNGIGKVTGTILMIQAKSRLELLATTYISELAKQIVMSVAGVLGLLFAFERFFEPDPFLWSVTLPVGIAVSITLIVLFFNIHLLERLLQRFSFLQKYVHHFSAFGRYSKKELASIIGNMSIRYGFMLTQYLIMLRFLGVEVPIIEGLLTIALIIILRSYLPLPPTLGILMRVELALYFWSQYTDNEISILATTFSLWMLNIVFPALIGMIFIGNTNVMKVMSYK